MTDLMNLATDYAQACYHLDPHSYDPKYTAEARAALQSAIAALQKEVSTLDVLLEECKMDWSGDVTQIKAEHKREIEALQAENERLKQELDKAQDEIHCAESSLEAFSCEFEAEVFNQGFDCLGEFVQALWTASNKQRDALQAKLDAMGKGEPDGNALLQAIARGWCSEKNSGKVMDALLALAIRDEVQKLFAAPKALAPDVDWLSNVIRQVDGNNKLGAGALAEKIVEAISAHGIGGTP